VSDEFLNPRTAERLARAARAAQTLSETLWEALHEELIDRSEIGQRGQRVAELSERLADISATVALLARVDASASSSPTQPAEPAEPAESGPRGARAVHDESRATSREPSSQWERTSPQEPSATREQPSSAVLVDELAHAAPDTREPPASREPSVQAPPEIEIRDERGERDPTAWIALIGRRLERYEQDGVGFAVLLIELADVERLRHAELPGEVARMTGLVETALANELRPADSFTRESPGRYWLLAPETDTRGARLLAERLADAVRRVGSHRGAPLEVAVGVATCPVDGSQAAALAAHADVALYAARAAGRPIA
jgi:GGDEF domain-containing protein